MLLTQAAFLQGMGVDVRLQKLLDAARREGGEAGKEKERRLREGVERLIGTGANNVAAPNAGNAIEGRGSGMGKEYKVLGITTGEGEDVLDGAADVGIEEKRAALKGALKVLIAAAIRTGESKEAKKEIDKERSGIAMWMIS